MDLLTASITCTTPTPTHQEQETSQFHPWPYLQHLKQYLVLSKYFNEWPFILQMKNYNVEQLKA